MLMQYLNYDVAKTSLKKASAWLDLGKNKY